MSPLCRSHIDAIFSSREKAASFLAKQCTGGMEEFELDECEHYENGPVFVADMILADGAVRSYQAYHGEHRLRHPTKPIIDIWRGQRILIKSPISEDHAVKCAQEAFQNRSAAVARP